MHKFIRKEFDNVPSSTGKIQDFNSSSPAWSFAWQTSGPCSKLFSRFLVKIIKLPPTKHQNFSKALAVINYLKCDPFCPFQKTLGSHPNLTILSKIFHTKQPPTPSTKAPSHHRTPVCQRDAAAAARAFTACRCRSWVRCVSRSAAFDRDAMRWDEVGGRRRALGDSWVKNYSTSHYHGVSSVENGWVYHVSPIYEDRVSFHLI